MHPISTRRAHCKDCYRCLRVCPVNAINIKDGQAKVRKESCILCGKCVLECPQQAKIIANESYKVIDYLETGKKVVLSLAPSFPGYFYNEEYPKLWDKLRKLGFQRVEETSLGAWYTKEAYSEFFAQKGHTTISSCCPVVVNLIEIYFPELLLNLAPVASPAIAHGLSIKERLGWDTKVVFASPCIGKISERGKEGKLDAVITFCQLAELLKGATTGPLKEGEDSLEGNLETRLFPLDGGTIRSFMGENLANSQIATVSGLEDCWHTLDAIRKAKVDLKFIELLACRGGCIGGPLMNGHKSLLERRQYVVEHYQRFKGEKDQFLEPLSQQLLARRFKNRAFAPVQVSEEILSQILAQIAIYTKEDERNCGGCGYNTCREKAQAVYSGHAELEMCMSYMKRKAESTAHTIVNSTPNAIIVFDQGLYLKELNPAAIKMFNQYALEIGEYLGAYIEIDHFQKVIENGSQVKDAVIYYQDLDLYTRQIVIPMEGSNHLFMAIITDVTAEIKKQRAMEEIKEEILTKANHVINNQMLVAQQIAGLLGETTAETKTTLLQLKKHFSQETERKSDGSSA